MHKIDATVDVSAINNAQAATFWANLEADLEKTVNAINRIDSQRYELNQRLIDVDNLVLGIAQGNFYLSLS